MEFVDGDIMYTVENDGVEVRWTRVNGNWESDSSLSSINDESIKALYFGGNIEDE